jgi:hypothetical protein
MEINECSGSIKAATEFSLGLEAYGKEPELARAKEEDWLDGPTYPIEQYNSEGEIY